MFNTEESRVAGLILLTFALLMVTGVYEPFVVIATIIVLIAITLFAIYMFYIQKKKPEPQDERTERCSFLATRNGFMAAITITALMAAVSKISATSLNVSEMMSTVWGLSVAAYLLTYMHHKKFV
jgi:hypothetical protein